MLLVTHDIDEASLYERPDYDHDAAPGRIERTIPIGLDRPRDRSSSRFPSGCGGEILELLHLPGTRWRQGTAEIVEAMKR